MGELFDFKTRKMVVSEKPSTPEKSKDELYFETLKAKRDVLSSHYTLGQLRKGRKVEAMSDAEIEDYKSVKKEYERRKELFLTSFDNLNEDDGQKVAELTSLTKVEIALSSLEKPAEAGAGVAAGEVVTSVEAESPDRGTTMAEVDRMLKYSQDTARPPRPLETAYWESKKAELLERQEAEANPDRPAPKGFLQRVKDSYKKVKDSIADHFAGANAISGGSETVESRMSPLGLRKEAMESINSAESAEPAQPIQPEVQPQPEARPQQPEKAAISEPRQEREPTKPSGWGWLKERGKGVWNFGIWEFHQAELFRSKTKEVANDTDALATLIQQERHLSLEEAQTEAQEIKNELKNNNVEGIGTAEFYQANSDIISERKKKENDQEIEYIIASTSNDLLDKLSKDRQASQPKYRGVAGQDVLTQENKLAFQADLRRELNKMRDGATRKDFINFAKLMRRNLDENWQWRYVWGAAEALAWVGVGWASMKFLASKEASAVAAKTVAGGAGGTEAAKKFVETGMHENVWNTLKRMAENGPGHFTPTMEQLKEWSQSVLDSINHYEPEWVNNAVEGLKSSRTMPDGTILKIPLAITKAMGY